VDEEITHTMHIRNIAGIVAHAILATTLLPALGLAAGYKFTSFQYPGADSTVFTGIDDTNRIVGYANFGSATQGIFVSSAGSLATINISGWDSTMPLAINRRGGVAGQVFAGSNYSMFQDNADGDGPVAGLLIGQTVSGINASFNTVGNFTSPDTENAVWANIGGNYHTLLPDPKCTYTHDPAINDENVVVGNCVNARLKSIVFTWSKGHYTYLTTPSDIPYIQATGITKSGVIAGWYTDTSGFDHGFVLDGTTFTTVDYPAPATNTQILGINAAGKIVGSYNGPGLTAFSATPQ
jgi:hypothetical protein